MHSPPTSPSQRALARLLAGYEHHADDVEIELVGDPGHFIADEKPALVAERARELFAPGP